MPPKNKIFGGILIWKENIVDIKDIKIPFEYVGTFIKNEGITKKALHCKWIDNKEIINRENSRVYIITVNGKIKKIGGSICKGGIKKTISCYESANLGKPSISRFSIMKEIEKELDNNNIVNIYVIFINSIIIEVCGYLGKRK